MERKVSDYEKRITGYEEMSKILQEQTMNLTTELQLKIEAAQKSESETRGLKTRTKSL